MATIAASVEVYDAIVIGLGQGGKPLAQAFAHAGRRVVVVERAAVGGSCVNFGCTPTKTLYASARVATLARRAGEYGVETGPVRVDFGAVQARQRRVVDRFREGAERSLERTAGIEVVFGHAVFASPDMVEVHGEDGRYRRLAAPLVFIDTGTRAARPAIEGLDEVEALDPGAIAALDRLPEHLVVLGGGYVGVEYAQMFRRFGSRVTLVEAAPRLMAAEDDDVSAALADLLRDEGVEVRTGVEARRLERVAAGPFRLHLADGGAPIDGTHLLLAAGRRPNTDDLALDAAGVETDERGYVRVDERLATNVEGVFALGDVTGGPAFTHVSYDHFRVLKANLVDGGDAVVEGRPVPYVVFTDPELGRIGLGEREARAERREVKVARLPMDRVARAVQSGETRGFLKAVVDARSERLLGAAVFGPYAGELMSLVQVAMAGDLPYTALRDGVFAHPTFAEALNNLFQRFES